MQDEVDFKVYIKALINRVRVERKTKLFTRFYSKVPKNWYCYKEKDFPAVYIYKNKKELNKGFLVFITDLDDSRLEEINLDIFFNQLI